jgi:hypothetical protein
MMNQPSGGISNLLVLEDDIFGRGITSMKKKIFVLIAILALIGLLSPRLIILSLATWDYYHTDVVCLGQEPMPPIGLEFPVSLDIYEVKPYSVLTRRGYIFPGNEYIRQRGDVLFEVADLLWAGSDGAVFLISYTINDPVKGNSSQMCRWFAPVGDYR